MKVGASMLDFFRSSKNKADPFANEVAAKAYIEALKQEFGAATHDKVTEMISGLNAGTFALSPSLLAAVLALNAGTQDLHEALCQQYLMNARMPKILEQQLRSQILNYDKQFLVLFQQVINEVSDHPEYDQFVSLLPQLLVRSMYYQNEYARWQFMRHFTLNDAFFHNVNKLYFFAETHKIDSVPVFLFDDNNVGTTVQDQFLVLLMLTQLQSGSLSARQLNFTYELLKLLSNRMTLVPVFSDDASFAIDLKTAQLPFRVKRVEVQPSMRFWNTSELVEIIHGWGVMLESGRVPPSLKGLIEPGVDAALLKGLCREWSVKAVLLNRAERVAVDNRHVEVVHRLPVLHRLIRLPDEANMQQQRQAESGSFDDAANIRIYGFITSRKRDKGPLGGAGGEGEIEPIPAQKWYVENISKTGMGVSFESIGNEWVGLGHLVGVKEESGSQWVLMIVRRLKRLDKERTYLGLETLSDRAVAASLRATDTRVLDTGIPAEQIWLAGHIALFVPFSRDNKNINALILPTSVYVSGRHYYMSARGKHFEIALGKVQEKGGDWCLAEIELVRPMEKLPVVL